MPVTKRILVLCSEKLILQSVATQYKDHHVFKVKAVCCEKEIGEIVDQLLTVSGVAKPPDLVVLIGYGVSEEEELEHHVEALEAQFGQGRPGLLVVEEHISSFPRRKRNRVEVFPFNNLFLGLST